jgi:serine/threonine-protein kinase HipA
MALSHALPLRPEAFAPDQARPFFTNLLPESNVRRLITEKLHISEKNDYALLEAIGGDCAGAFSLWPEGRKPPTKEGRRPIRQGELGAWLSNIPQRPLIQAAEGLRLSLAGAQDKLPVISEGDNLWLPEGISASTHILKPAIERLEDSVGNECFCLQLAAAVGLPVVPAKIFEKPSPYLLVERYDRLRDASGKVRRLHQEDFCQALGVLSENKYEAEGGPSLVDCFRILAEESSHLLEDRRSLLRWIIFNVLIGNADAHAKNIAILRLPSGVRLAPFYDLLSTAVYPNLSRKMAMKIGDENRLDWIQARHWDRMAQAIEVKESLVRNYAVELAAALPQAARSLLSQFTNRPFLLTLCELIKKNSERLKARLDA